MQLMTYKTLWGHPDCHLSESLELACAMAKVSRFDGIEGPVPRDKIMVEELAKFIRRYSLSYIAEICTAGSYVPDRSASVAEHLADLGRQLHELGPLRPELVNCIGGCDGWSIDNSLKFFKRAMELAERAGVAISFETHRGRSLYSPWVTETILEQMPLPLTCDFSHWQVVCEGMGPTEHELIKKVAQSARHIHGRVGFDQGPQVADLQSPLYQTDIEQHWQWWRWIWQAQRQRGFKRSTFTPEFGPDGYQMRDPRNGQPIGNLVKLNLQMAERAQQEFVRCLSLAF